MERIPFDYDKYAADPSGWTLFTADDNQVVYLIETTESDDDYPFKGVYKSPEGRAQEATWTKEGHYVTSDRESLKNISYMTAVHKEKPVETKVVSSLTPRLRNIFYNRESNAVVMGIKTHELWTHALMSANSTMFSKPTLEHLCVVTLEDHPQIREILIAKGLAEVVVDTKLEEIDI